MALPRRIALVITELEVGGAERCLVELACGLPRERFAAIVYVLAPRPLQPRDQLATRLEQSRLEVHYLGFRHRWRLPAAVRALRARLRRQRPHVVQSMLFHANVVSCLAVGRRKPAALSLGLRVADPTRWRQIAEGRLSRRADRVVCVSQSVADHAATHLGVPASRLTVIANGVNVQACLACDPADLTTWGVPPGRRVVTCVSRLARQKGVDVLLRAAPAILAGLPDHNLLIVGSGPEKPALDDLASQLGIAHRLHFTGWQPHVPAILRASDMLVLASRWEGMPNVMLEAMACRLPVVSTMAEGVGQILGPLADAQTVPRNSPEMLSAKVLNVLREPGLAAHLGTANWQRVADHFSVERMVEAYAQLFDALSEQPPERA